MEIAGSRNGGTKLAVRKTKSQKPDESNFCAYIGPTIRGVIQNGTIFPCSCANARQLPLVKIASEKFQEIPFLVVSGAMLAEARQKIRKPGTLLFAKNEALCARMKEVNK